MEGETGNAVRMDFYTFKKKGGKRFAEFTRDGINHFRTQAEKIFGKMMPA